MSEIDASISQTEKPILCYRIRRDYLVLSIVGLVFFLGMDIAGVLTALWNVDGSFPNPLAMALVCGSVLTFMVILDAMLIVICVRTQLDITEKTITYQGIFKRKIIRMENVTRIIWRGRRPNATIRVYGDGLKIKLELGLYRKEQREQLIEFMQNAFGPDIQVGWERFAEPPRPPSPARVVFFYGYGALLTFGLAGFYVYLSIVVPNTRSVVMAGLNAALGVWFVWRYLRWRVKQRAATR